MQQSEMKINRICLVIFTLLLIGGGNSFSQNEGANSQVTEQTDDAFMSSESEMLDNVPAPSQTETPDNVPAPSQSEMPDNAPAPSQTETPDNAPAPSQSEMPDNAPAPSQSEMPDNAPAPSQSEMPDNAPAPSQTETPDNAAESEPPADVPTPSETVSPNKTAESAADELFPFFSEIKGEYILAVDKKTQHLFVYAHDGTVRALFRMRCSTGKAAGPKNVAGDLKTPEGIYFFIKEHEKKELAPIYGTRAFPTDYPNVLDQAAGKTGDAIWLHGTNKPLKPMDSSGCVVLENSNIDKIRNYITLNRTPFVITDRILHESLGSDEISAIRSLVSGWKDALGKGSYHEYLSFYDEEYLPDISWWQEWRKTRKTMSSSQASLSLEAKNILIIRRKEIYAVLCDLAVGVSDRDAYIGAKKFFLTQRGQQFRIIGESWQGMPEDKPEKPLFAACRNLETRRKTAPAVAVRQPEIPAEEPAIVTDKPEIGVMIADWLDAWSSKDMNRYGSHYAEDFRSQGMNLKAWLAYKNQLNQKYDYIRVSKKNEPVIRKSGEMLSVSFVQLYESDAFRSVGLKQLVLKHESGQWKIYRETSKKM